MKIKLISILLFLFIIAGRNRTIDVSECDKIKTILFKMSTWRKSQSSVSYPLMGKRDRPLLSHPFLLGGNRQYYANGANLYGEYASEFGIDDNGVCSFTARIGPFEAEKIDEKGVGLRNEFLGCVNGAHWQISSIKDTYLYMTYDSVDVTVSIMKRPISNSTRYALMISMARFTPLK